MVHDEAEGGQPERVCGAGSPEAHGADERDGVLRVGSFVVQHGLGLAGREHKGIVAGASGAAVINIRLHRKDDMCRAGSAEGTKLRRTA